MSLMHRVCTLHEIHEKYTRITQDLATIPIDCTSVFIYVNFFQMIISQTSPNPYPWTNIIIQTNSGILDGYDPTFTLSYIQSYILLYILQKVNSWPAYQVSGYQPSKTKKVCGHKRVTVNTDRLHQRVKSRTPNGASTLLNLCSNYKVIQFWEGI